MLPFSEACERNKHPILDVLRADAVFSADTLHIMSGQADHAMPANNQLLVWRGA